MSELTSTRDRLHSLAELYSDLAPTLHDIAEDSDDVRVCERASVVFDGLAELMNQNALAFERAAAYLRSRRARAN